MHDSVTCARPSAPGPSSRLRAACEVGLIFLVFFIQGAWLAPHVNEPHYLGKARHYWDASWCPDDFFLNSADAHQVFYWTFGWLARVMPFAPLAWFGRALTWVLLAWAWRRLSWALVPAPFYAVLSAALMVTLIDHFQMAGEWLIGGVEAKGFAYVLVLVGLEWLVRERWGRAIMAFGAVAAFHVVIGGWCVVAAGVVWLACPQRPPLARLVLPLLVGGCLSLAGLLPALTLARGVEPQVVAEANRIYVYERLYHHLLPQQFPLWFVVEHWGVLVVVRHLLLIGGLLLLIWTAGKLDAAWRRLLTFVAATVGIAAVGMVIALVAPAAPDLAASLLRFYWFRTSDVLVPVGTALLASHTLWRWQHTQTMRHAVALTLVLVVVAGHFAQLLSWRQRHPWPPADAGIADLAGWREACEWARANTPADAVFLTPRLAQTFRWYAARAEVVSRKDIPQDAAGIVEWWRRNCFVHMAGAGTPQARWRRSLTELSAAQLRTLGRQFGADYVITEAEPPLALPQVGPTRGGYAIYQLSSERGTGSAGKN
ncbi:MAG: DUF6798 domain-containing protein [Pirellulales bacterium]